MNIVRRSALTLGFFAGWAVALTVSCEFASGQTLSEINKRNEAVLEAWKETPFLVRNACFVAEAPECFGVYTPRSPAPFKSGESMIVYAEPVAYGWKSVESDQYEFGFTIDLIVKTAAGKKILEKDTFGNMMFKSRAQNRELFLKLTVDLSGADPGDYLLDFRVHDAEAENKTAMIELPITLE
jgi:hypothetical protein